MNVSQFSTELLEVLKSQPVQRVGLPVAYTSALAQVNLDFSNTSVERLNYLIDGLVAKTNPDYQSFISHKSKRNFLYLLTFYLGEVLAKLSGQSVTWLESKEDALYDELQLRQFIAVFSGIEVRPQKYLVGRIFRNSEISCMDYVADVLEQIKLNESATSKGTTSKSAAIKSDNNGSVISDAQLTKHSKYVAEQKKPEPQKQSKPVPNPKLPSEAIVTNKHIDQLAEAPKKQGNVQRQIVENKLNRDATTDLDLDNSKEQPSYEERFGVNYNANLLKRFKPPVKLPLLLSILPVLLMLYVVKRMVFNNGLDVTHAVWLGVFILLLIAVWINYFLSYIGVYDTKVSKFSLLGTTQTQFDNRTRFYHIQSDGKLFGTPQHVLIKTNIAILPLQAQNQSQLEDVLLDVEAALLEDRLLKQLYQGDTIDFELVSLSAKNITYGAKVMPVSQIADYGIKGNDLSLMTKEGGLFARLDMKSVPNVQTLVNLIEKINQPS